MRIFLVRHGESLGNVNRSAYAELLDHNVPLTQWGYEQAKEAGNFIKEYYDSRPDLKDKKLRIWYSPFLRTKQTKNAFLEGLGPHRAESVREDYLLREQDMGVLHDIPDREKHKERFPEEYAKFKKSMEMQGKFYARPPMGESRADVAQRVRIFKETLMRDVKAGKEDVVIIAHGTANRAFEMDFLHKGVEWFENEPNPGNCDITLIEGDRAKGYAATCIYRGKSRPPSLPKDYKAFAYGQDQAETREPLDHATRQEQPGASLNR